MSCFWDGIGNFITRKEFKKRGLKKNPTPDRLIQFFKNNNMVVTKVKWNDTYLTELQQKENYDHVRTCKKQDGYLCSSCDPFLFLICELFEISIVHKYNSNLITYTFDGKSKKTIHVQSNSTHFWV